MKISRRIRAQGVMLTAAVILLNNTSALGTGRQGDLCQGVSKSYGGELPNLRNLADEAERVSSEFKAPSADTLQNARHRLYRALNALKAYIKNPDVWVTWREYLGWVEAVSEFNHDTDANIDLGKFHKMRRGLVSEFVNGLDKPVFSEAREALDHWAGLVSVVQMVDVDDAHQKHLLALAEGLRDRQGAGSLSKIKGGLHWLKNSAQYPELQNAILCHFSHDNFRIIASETLLERLMPDELSQTVFDASNIRQWSEGTFISGKAITRGNLKIDVVPNNRFAQIDLVFNARVDTHVSASASQRGLLKTRRYVIPMAFWTNVEGRKPLLLSEHGVSAVNAHGNASTSSSVSNYVYSNALLGNRLALSQAHARQPQARQSTSQAAIAEVTRRLNQEAAAPVAEAQDSFNKDFRIPFRRRSAGPEHLKYHSKAEQIFIDMLVTGQEQIGADSPMPGFSNQGNDLTFVVHQSFASNFSSAFQSGETVTHNDVAVRLADLFDQVPRELDTNSPLAKPWSMTFAEQGGVTFEFKEDCLRLCFVTVDFEVRRQRQNSGFQACASYGFAADQDSINFVRRGDVEYQFNGQADESAKQFILKKIKAMFLESFEWKNVFTIPGEWARIGKLQLKDFGVKDGWMWFGYKVR